MKFLPGGFLGTIISILIAVILIILVALVVSKLGGFGLHIGHFRLGVH